MKRSKKQQIGSLMAAACLAGAVQQASAQTTYTWTQTGAGGSWSAAAWDGGPPVEADDAIVQFFSGTPTVTANFTASNDIKDLGSSTTAFDLEKLILNGGGSNKKITISGATLKFLGDANGISFNGGSSLDYEITGSVNFTNGLTIDGSSGNDKTFSGVISGSGGLTFDVSGRVYLTRVNTYGGGTTINGGTFVLNNDDNFGNSTLTLNGGVLSNTGLYSTGTPEQNSRDLAVNVVFGGNAQIMNTSIQGGNYSLGTASKTIDLGGETRVISTDRSTTGADTSSSTVSLLGKVNNGGITKSGRGGMRLSNAGNSYAGATTVRMGTLTVAANALAGVNGALGNATSAVELGDESTSSANTIRFLIAGGNFEVGRNINVNNFNDTGETTLGASGDVDATYSGTIALGRDVQVQSSSVGGNAVHFTGNITGNFGLSISGSGNVHFANAKSYSGVTTVSSTSTLQVDGSIANSAVALEGTLKGNGTTGAVTMAAGSTLAPGASIGQLNTGTLDMTAGGAVSAEINSDTLATDRINVAGDLLLAGDTATLTLTDLGTNQPIQQMVLIAYTGTWDGGIFAGLANGSSFAAGADTYTIRYDTDLGGGVHGVTVVPEPAGLSILALAGAGLLSRRKRKN